MVEPRGAAAQTQDRPGRPHLCILTTAHPVDDVRVNSKVAASFLAAGFQVSWVGPSRADYTDQLSQDDRIAYHLVRSNRGRRDRLTAGWRVRKAARALVAVDWWYSPDPDAAELSVQMAREKGGRVIFDIHEIFHGARLDRYVFGRRAALIRRYVRARVARTCRRADLVIGVNRSVLEPYVTDWSAACVVRNSAPASFSDVPRARPTHDTLRVMHGKALTGNGTPVIVKALAEVPAAAGRPVCVVMFSNTGPDRLTYSNSLRGALDQLSSQGSLQLLDGVRHQDMPQVLATCDVGMIAYGRGLGEGSLPNRLFEYMGAGLAILAPTYSSEIRAIVDAEQIGIAADFDDAADVARALAWLAANPEECRLMGDRARAAFLRAHHWEVEFEGLLTAMGGRTTCVS